MAKPRKVTLRESELETASEAHELLSHKLDFPEYYGCNLDALEECLGEIATPTRIVVVRKPDGSSAWFDALVEVVCSSAQRSCYLGCSIR